MIINYPKLNRALSIFFIAAVLFTVSCSKKSGDPNPNNGTQTDNTPTITSISPASSEYNTEVVIYGTNFSSTLTDDKVYFNGKAATVTAATSTQLTVKVPQDAGTGAVTISVKGGTTVTGPVFGYAESVKITSTDISSGTPGTVVKITGVGFSSTIANNQVNFNGKTATVTAATATQLTVTVPAGASTGPITVSVNSKPAVTGPIFTYLETLKIISTDVNKGIAGATVNITGTGFSTNLADNKVFFNGMTATVTAATATQLTVKVPQSAGVGKITATVNGTTVTGPDFNYYLSSTVTTIIGNNGFGFADGPLSSAQIGSATELAMDMSGNIYILDGSNYRLRKVSVGGNITTIAGKGPGLDPDGGPQHITVDKGGNIYYDALFGYTYKISPAGNISTFSQSDYSWLAADKNGNLYSTAMFTGLVFKISNTGTATVVAGSQSGVSKDGTGTNADFFSPQQIVVAPSGNIYVFDNVQIRKITPSYEVTTIPTPNLSISGMVVDKDENIYITSPYDYQVKRIDPSGNISVVAGSSSINQSADGDQFTSGFSNLFGITCDSSGNIYVGDGFRLRKITLN